MATITLDAGTIIALQYRSSRGEHTIQRLKQIETASYQFDEATQMSKAQPDLPSTEVILQQLGAAEGQARGVPATPQAAVVSQITDEQKQIIEKTLANYAGPFASIVCRDVFTQVAELDEVLDTLGRKMPNRDQADAFFDEVNENLKLV